MPSYVKSPVTFDAPSIIGFVLAVAVAVIVAKKLPFIGKQL